MDLMALWNELPAIAERADREHGTEHEKRNGGHNDQDKGTKHGSNHSAHLFTPGRSWIDIPRNRSTGPPHNLRRPAQS